MRAPFELTVDSGGDQFPVTGAMPRLSWKFDPAGVRPVFEVEASIDGAPAPGIHSTSLHRFVSWPWAELSSGQRVSWRVRCIQGVGKSDWSKWAAFEAGLRDEDWTAAWISPVPTPDAGRADRPAHLLRGDFHLDAPVASARLYATALGIYTATVNGERIGRTELSPGSTSYDRTLYAQAADVTDALVPGANRIEIELSDGWYRGNVGAFRIPAEWGDELAVRLEVHVHHADGSRRVIGTDAGWTSSASRIMRADLMDGQSVDFTRPASDDVAVIVGAVDAPPIEWSPAPPVRVIEARAPRSVHAVGEGVWIVDFGQNASGWVRLTELGPLGTVTTLDYGEHLGSNGDIDTAHLDSTRPGQPPVVFRQHDEVTAGEAADVFEPRHTVHGFQFVRVTRRGAPFDAASITMQIVHTDLARVGTFACSDEDLNRLHQIADWSFRGNAVDVPTDCPTRERLAWTGDYQIFAPTATRLYDVRGFSRKWLRSVRDDQLDDGRIANFSPDGRRIKHHLDDQFAMMTGSAGWGDAIVAVPWELYESSGDAEVLAENWEAMVRWVQWALEKARTERHHARARRHPHPEPFEDYLWDGTFHWGEWTEPREKRADGTPIDPVKDDPMTWFMADKGEVGTAYLYRSTSTLARIAAVLGHDELAARYTDIAERIRSAWQAAYLRPDGTTATDSQASYVRSLSFDLVPEPLRNAAARRLVELIRSAGTHLRTGFLSTGDLLPVLADTGHADVAYELLLQRTAPSWLNMIDRGATTIWEDWEGIDESGVAHESLNHYSKGAVVRFLHTHVLGLRQAPGSVAWESVVVEPVLGGSLTWARGMHDGPQGPIRVEWRIDGDELHIAADVPAATRARIVFPDGTSHEAGPGAFSGRRPLPHATPHLTPAL
ncbi:family 78 glycoside hydrolase catalytic domain [uncultured Microbacterium sp.]|uniref:alpha-L-rhamnosidase n=1 Tax=uncultured Microbacterium sp. TaxID=191216 RepID=UPI0028D219C6|nr:family 78 glycoside hydrolase catalytic domain [uncultured Microbacterium sp.]